jgi:NitT/TauT family transport system permease protein
MKKLLQSLLALAFWLLVWQLLALRTGSALLLPAPLETLRRLCELLPTADFWRTVGATLLRILCGVLSGTLLGMLLAVLTSAVPLLHTLFSPLLTVIKSTPIASFIILLLIWIGRDALPSVIVILIVVPVDRKSVV